MQPTIASESWICGLFLARNTRSRVRPGPRHAPRCISTTPRRLNEAGGKHDAADVQPPEKGAMSRRLEEMTERSLEEGGRSARKAVDEAGFSAELKKQLEARILDGKSRSLDRTASTVLSMPASAGVGTRDAALAEPWSGIESTHDASLRMLTDAHKPLRSSSGDVGRSRRIGTPGQPPVSVDMRMKAAVKGSRGERLANARDRTSIYALGKDANMSDKEKEEFRKILKDRFSPSARTMPATLQGLASLANERIEDAIARGQFKNIRRGKGVGQKVDYNANSPFINTTEYFMNKMIQRQEIVPPWIEKQQEVVKNANAFRQRLRNDWKRHAARTIASHGGSLQEQIRRAEAYAVVEAKLNPKTGKVEALNQVDAAGKVSQVNVVETPLSDKAGADAEIIAVETQVGEDMAEVVAEVAATTSLSTKTPDVDETQPKVPDDNTKTPEISEDTSSPPTLELAPFRDPAWERIELAYHRAALAELNNLTRSYNLMAPELAKKPYFILERELASCFADVATQVPAAILDRAQRTERRAVVGFGQSSTISVLDKLSGPTTKVYDSKKPNYGFKEFWQDLWQRKDGKSA